MRPIEARALSKSFAARDYTVRAVKNADFSAEEGEIAAIVGPSGSGKSTLLNMLGLVLAPDSGEVTVCGTSPAGMNDRRLSALRNASFGYITQDFSLLDDETVYTNIRLPLIYNRSIRRSEHRERILAAAESLGLSDKLKRKASRLSGGERQRTAIARAIVCGQPIILADEPTGSLDAENRDRVVEILAGLARRDGRTVLIVTHDMTVAERCDRIIRMKDGEIL